MSDDNHIHILDSTLRDGSHALSHQLTAVQVARVAQGLNDAGVEIIEVSHGDGLGGSTITYGFSKQSEFELLDAAAGSWSGASWRCCCFPESAPRTTWPGPGTWAPR